MTSGLPENLLKCFQHEVTTGFLSNKIVKSGFSITHKFFLKGRRDYSHSFPFVPVCSHSFPNVPICANSFHIVPKRSHLCPFVPWRRSGNIVLVLKGSRRGDEIGRATVVPKFQARQFLGQPYTPCQSLFPGQVLLSLRCHLRRQQEP